MIALTQLTNTGIFAFVAALVFELLSCEIFVVNKKDIRNYEKIDNFFRKFKRISLANYCQIINCCNAKFSEKFQKYLKYISVHLSVLF